MEFALSEVEQNALLILGQLEFTNYFIKKVVDSFIENGRLQNGDTFFGVPYNGSAFSSAEKKAIVFNISAASGSTSPNIEAFLEDIEHSVVDKVIDLVLNADGISSVRL